MSMQQPAKNKVGKTQAAMIRRHNAQMKIIAKVSEESGFSEATLFYATHLGIMGLFTYKKRQ